MVQSGDHSRVAAAILIADDCAASLDTLASALAPLGPRIVRAGAGEEVLEQLAREDYAVVFLGLRLRGLDGFATATRIRSRPRSRKTPIIFVVSGDRAGDDAARALAHGVDFVTLPCDPRLVRARAATFLEWFAQSQAHRQQLSAIRH